MKLAIYNLLILLLIPILQVRILLKSLKDKGYRSFMAQRYASNLAPAHNQKEKLIWFHAVSLGEVIASQVMIRELMQEFDVVLTTTTPTGLRKAQEIYKDSLVINYAPWDLGPLVNKFLNFYNPSALLIFETEIWPSMINSAHNQKIPIFLMNGRLSYQSYKAYLKVSWFLKDILQKITFTFVQTPEHRERFLQLGLDSSAIEVAGSVKFDAPGLKPETLSLPKFILGASTHLGEEEMLLRVFQKLQKERSHKLFICPRHPERSTEILKAARKMHFRSELYSQLDGQDYDVCIIDSIGLLQNFYNIADLAFVGGSLVPRGGHNLIEPATMGTPIIIGNHTFNFEEIAKQFIQSNSCILVTNEQELLEGITSILGDSGFAVQLAENAKSLVARNEGSTQTQVSYIIDKLGVLH